MYCTPRQILKARKPHMCTSCGEEISKGSEYTRWASFDDGAYTNKMHPECYKAHDGDSLGGYWDYTPYSYQRGEAG